MKIKQITFFCYIIIIIMLTIGCQENQLNNNNPQTELKQGSNLQTILERGKIKVGTTGDFNPMSFKDPNTGDYVGHDIEMVKQLAADMGVEVEFVPTDWKNLVSGVAAGKYDITTGAGLNIGRAKTAGYTQPYLQVGTVPMMLKSNKGKFNSWEDINNADVKVAITLGTLFEEQARLHFPNAQIVAVEAPARDFQDVLAGRADISVTSTLEASALVQTYPELMIVPVDKPRNANQIALLVAQDDQVLINFLNVWITQKKAEGYFDQLKTKWISINY